MPLLGRSVTEPARKSQGLGHPHLNRHRERHCPRGVSPPRNYSLDPEGISSESSIRGPDSTRGRTFVLLKPSAAESASLPAMRLFPRAPVLILA
jgi:hypothetical protein